MSTKQTIRCSRLQKQIDVHPRAKCRITVVGRDNVVIVRSPDVHSEIMVFGSGNTVIIDEGCMMGRQTYVYIGSDDSPTWGVTIHIGKRCRIGNRVVFRAMDAGSSIDIGEDSLFSDRIEVWCTDSHAILGADGSLLNRGHSVTVGRHCWIGMDCKLGKGAGLPDDCAVGWGSVVTRRFAEPHCVVAGAPAKVVRSNVHWDEHRPNHFLPPPPECSPEAWEAELRIPLRKNLWRWIVGLLSPQKGRP